MRRVSFFFIFFLSIELQLLLVHYTHNPGQKGQKESIRSDLQHHRLVVSQFPGNDLATLFVSHSALVRPGWAGQDICFGDGRSLLK